jgi:hypothetical protein
MVMGNFIMRIVGDDARGGSHDGEDILEGEFSALFTAEKSASSKYWDLGFVRGAHRQHSQQ